MSYFSIELHVGDQIYKTPVCIGNPDLGFVQFGQLFSTHIDDDVLEAVSTSIRDGTPGPALTAIIWDCGRRFKNTVGQAPVFEIKIEIARVRKRPRSKAP